MEGKGSTMARLIVSAFSEDTVAAPGNRKPNYVVASVTDHSGVPVTGLTASKTERISGGNDQAIVLLTEVAHNEKTD